MYVTNDEKKFAFISSVAIKILDYGVIKRVRKTNKVTQLVWVIMSTSLAISII